MQLLACRLLLQGAHHLTRSWLHSSWTNKLIRAKDHSSVQINIGHLDEEGVYNKQFTTFALSGKVRGSVRAGLCGVCCLVQLLCPGCAGSEGLTSCLGACAGRLRLVT